MLICIEVLCCLCVKWSWILFVVTGVVCITLLCRLDHRLPCCLIPSYLIYYPYCYAGAREGMGKRERSAWWWGNQGVWVQLDGLEEIVLCLYVIVSFFVDGWDVVVIVVLFGLLGKDE